MNTGVCDFDGFVSGSKRFFHTGDELSHRNIRRDLWPLLLIFPMTVVLGDFRYFDLHISLAGLQSYELMLYPLGLGWLVLALIPQRLILPLLKTAAVSCAMLMPFQLLLTADVPKLATFMAFQFFNGICAACAFSFFCFKLNNAERLFGMALIVFYYSLYYTLYRNFPAVQAVYKIWGGIAVMTFYLVMVFFLESKLTQVFTNTVAVNNIAARGITDNTLSETSKVKMVIALHIIYYSMRSMINYIETTEHIIYSFPYGLGQFVSIIMTIFIMLISSRSALYIWLMFLVFSLVGLSIVGYHSEAAHFAGSLVYGLGDGLGYIIIFYLCSGVIRQSARPAGIASTKIYRFFCFVLFIEYFFISGILSQAFGRYRGSNHVIALGVVLFLCACSFLIIPFLQKRLFETGWTGGLYLKDMEKNKNTRGLAQTEAFNAQEHLNLTEREHEVFTLLLKGVSLKQIAFILKVRFSTVDFYRSNLYRKLGVQSRAELSAKYGTAATQKKAIKNSSAANL